MTHSKRSQPIRGITTCDSEKLEKRQNNRKLRRKVKAVVESDLVEVLPQVREVSNVWVMGKDGKKRFDQEKYPDLLRK